MQTLRDYLCPNDGKLLFRGVLYDSDVEIKCRGCKQIVRISSSDHAPQWCAAVACPNRQVYNQSRSS